MPELVHVRKFPAEAERVETGPIAFGDDWPGTFIRGDDSYGYVQQLKMLLVNDSTEFQKEWARGVLRELIGLLESSNAKNNDAFPAWHKDEAT